MVIVCPPLLFVCNIIYSFVSYVTSRYGVFLLIPTLALVEDKKSCKHFKNNPKFGVYFISCFCPVSMCQCRLHDGASKGEVSSSYPLAVYEYEKGHPTALGWHKDLLGVTVYLRPSRLQLSIPLQRWAHRPTLDKDCSVSVCQRTRW